MGGEEEAEGVGRGWRGGEVIGLNELMNADESTVTVRVEADRDRDVRGRGGRLPILTTWLEFFFAGAGKGRVCGRWEVGRGQ